MPFIAKPVKTRPILSGKPNTNDGPCRIMEKANNRKEIKISNLLGTFPTMKFTKIQLIV